MGTATPPSSSQSKCYKCWRIPALCYCSQITMQKTRLEWVILQHPRERKRSIGTARIAHLGLQNSRICVGTDFRQDKVVQEILSDSSRRCFLLFPGADSLDFSRLTPSERDTWLDARIQPTVFVLDGTWSTAKTLLNRTPELLQLPKICFKQEDAPSEYGFRQQPAPHCLSTLEAMCRLMKWVEPHVDSHSLLEVFRKMVQLQLNHTPHLMPPLLKS